MSRSDETCIPVLTPEQEARIREIVREERGVTDPDAIRADLSAYASHRWEKISVEIDPVQQEIDARVSEFFQIERELRLHPERFAKTSPADGGNVG